MRQASVICNAIGIIHSGIAAYPPHGSTSTDQVSIGSDQPNPHEVLPCTNDGCDPVELRENILASTTAVGHHEASAREGNHSLEPIDHLHLRGAPDQHSSVLSYIQSWLQVAIVHSTHFLSYFSRKGGELANDGDLVPDQLTISRDQVSRLLGWSRRHVFGKLPSDWRGNGDAPVVVLNQESIAEANEFLAGLLEDADPHGDMEQQAADDSMSWFTGDIISVGDRLGSHVMRWMERTGIEMVSYDIQRQQYI